MMPAPVAAVLLKAGAVAALAAGAIAAYAWWAGQLREEGRQEVRAEWAAATARAEAARAQEAFRRYERQQEIADATQARLTALEAALRRERAGADRLRQQAADAARQWADRLADSPSAADVAAAGAAIGVCTDLLGRADRRASLLAAYADAARTAGLSCEAEYDALTASKRETP